MLPFRRGNSNHLTNLEWNTKSVNNGRGKKLNRTYSSNYNGVSWCNHQGKWRAAVWIKPKVKGLGYFGCEIEAAKTFDQYCIQHNLDKHLNFK